jgi:AraC family transcriptional regulator
MSNFETIIEAGVSFEDVSVEITRHVVSSPGELRFQRPVFILSKSLSAYPPKSQIWVTVDGSSRPFDAGPTVLLPSDLAVRIPEHSAGAYRCIRCCISAKRFRSVTGLEGSWGTRELMDCLNLTDPIIDDCMWRLAGEVSKPGFASGELIESICTSLLIVIARKLRHEPVARENLTGRLGPRQLDQIHRYLGDLRGHPIRVRDLARACGISAAHLSRVFRQTTGKTVHAYVEQIRLDRARTLLANTSLSVKQISWTLGFSSSSSFCVAFDRAIGETPSQFRRRINLNCERPN